MDKNTAILIGAGMAALTGIFLYTDSKAKAKGLENLGGFIGGNQGGIFPGGIVNPPAPNAQQIQDHNQVQAGITTFLTDPEWENVTGHWKFPTLEEAKLKYWMAASGQYQQNVTGWATVEYPGTVDEYTYPNIGDHVGESGGGNGLCVNVPIIGEVCANIGG